MTRLRRFLRECSGVAALEFALIAPMLLILYMGASQVSVGVTLNRKLQNVANTTADLIGQVDSTSKTEISSILKIARALVEPYDSAMVKIVISSVTIDANGRTTVDWSQAINGAKAYTKNKIYTLPTSFSQQRGRSFVVAEVEYTYQPLGGFGLKSAIAMHEAAYFTPRNTQTAIVCSDC